MHRHNRQPKYTKVWATKAKSLLYRINGAIALAECYGKSALDWLLPMKRWVQEIADSEAPAWWTDEDCAAVLPQAEDRVKQFVRTIEVLRPRCSRREAKWAA